MAADHAQQIVDKVQRRLNWELERPDIMSYVIQDKNMDKTTGGSSLSISEINVNFNILTVPGSDTVAGVWLPGGASHLFKSTKRHENTTC